MFRITLEDGPLCVAHKLELPYDSKCNNLHGHNYRVKVVIEGDKLNGNGMLVDFTHVKAVFKRFDHVALGSNLLGHGGPCVPEVTPSTAEVFASVLLEAIDDVLLLHAASGTRVASLTVWETEKNEVTIISSSC